MLKHKHIKERIRSTPMNNGFILTTTAAETATATAAVASAVVAVRKRNIRHTHFVMLLETFSFALFRLHCVNYMTV